MSDDVRYDAFIAHASEDKDAIVRPLADGLGALGLRIWYDEYTLSAGDRLRRSIDKGLNGSKYGIVILSHSFFAKHWPQIELDGLAQRETDGRKVILPVWHKLGYDDVRRYSPTLADRIALISDVGIDSLVVSLANTMWGDLAPAKVIQTARQAQMRSIEVPSEPNRADGRLSDPILVLNEGLRASPGNVYLKDELAFQYGLLGETDQEIRVLRELVVQCPTECKYYSRLAHAYFQRKQYGEVRRILIEAVQHMTAAIAMTERDDTDRDNEDTLEWQLLQAHIHLGDYYAHDLTDALLSFSEYPEKKRSNPRAAIRQYERALAIAHEHGFKFRYSIARYERGWTATQEKLAVLYEERGDIDAALRLLRELVKDMDSDTATENAYKRETLKRIGNVLSSAQRYAQAIEAYRTASEVRIDDFEIRDALKGRESRLFYLMGMAYFRTGLYGDAIGRFRQGLALDVDDTHEVALLHSGLAVAYDEAGDPHEALYHYKRRVELEPSDAGAHNNLGYIYLKLGLKPKAKMEFEEALRLDPGHELAKDNLRSL